MYIYICNYALCLYNLKIQIINMDCGYVYRWKQALAERTRQVVDLTRKHVGRGKTVKLGGEHSDYTLFVQ